MKKIIDTAKLGENGKDILMLANDFDNLIETLFDRLTLMTTNTFEWVGDTAKQYERNAKLDKLEYKELRDDIYKLGNELINIASSYEMEINKNRL